MALKLRMNVSIQVRSSELTKRSFHQLMVKRYPLYLYIFRTKIDDSVGQNIGIGLAIVTYYGNAVKLIFISNTHILWMNEPCYSIMFDSIIAKDK